MYDEQCRSGESPGARRRFLLPSPSSRSAASSFRRNFPPKSICRLVTIWQNNCKEEITVQKRGHLRNRGTYTGMPVSAITKLRRSCPVLESHTRLSHNQHHEMNNGVVRTRG